jgi:hypothetical protein
MHFSPAGSLTGGIFFSDTASIPAIHISRRFFPAPVTTSPSLSTLTVNLTVSNMLHSFFNQRFSRLFEAIKPGIAMKKKMYKKFEMKKHTITNLTSGVQQHIAGGTNYAPIDKRTLDPNHPLYTMVVCIS